MPCHLERKVFNRCPIRHKVCLLLTVHDHTHILDEAVDDLERLSRGSSSLVLRESVQPLQDSLNVLPTEASLYKFDCVALSKVTGQQGRTHLVVPA
jgi:hypothetical protein